jgi:Tfp pilus assembly protein PilF
MTQQAHALTGIGQCHLHQSEPAQAASPLRQALSIYQRTGSPNAIQIEQLLTEQHLS